MTQSGAHDRRLFWTLHLWGWAAFGVGMALTRLGRYPIGYMIATKAALAISGAVVALALRALYKRTLPDDAPLGRTLVVTVVASFVVSQAWTAIYNLSDAPIATAMLDRRVSIETVSQLFAASYYHTFAMLAWSVLYVGIKRQLALQRERERALRAEALAQQARLQALRFQIQPHFLFNTLNAVSTLVTEGRSAEATQMLSRLSDFLRHTLAGPDGEEVALSDELEFARRYLEIEQVRFGDRLAVEIDAPEDVRGARVPNMLLQPLLENAVRHGIAPRVKGGTIRVVARRDGNFLRLRVTDGGAELPYEHSPSQGNGSGSRGGGVGLSNTRARLEQLYRGAHRMETGRTEDGGGGEGGRGGGGGDGSFWVDIAFPFRERDE